MCVPDAAVTAGLDSEDDDCVCRVDVTCFSGLLSTSASGTTLAAELHDDTEEDVVPHLQQPIHSDNHLPHRNRSGQLLSRSQGATEGK